jgi:quercetin dioxygenase-like cupin family protein
MTKRSARELLASLDDLEAIELVPAAQRTGGAVTAKIAYGTDMSMMVATREPGYHSKPHMHDAEQLNYVLAGELWIFIDDVFVVAREGDFFRVPKNAVHWSWVKGDTPCTLLEAHSPPLLGDAPLMAGATALVRAGETLTFDAIPSEWPEGFDRDAAEAAAFARKSEPVRD